MGFNLDGVPSAGLDRMDGSSSPIEVDSRTSGYCCSLYFLEIFPRYRRGKQLSPCKPISEKQLDTSMDCIGALLQLTAPDVYTHHGSTAALTTFTQRLSVASQLLERSCTHLWTEGDCRHRHLDIKRSGVSLQKPQDHLSFA